MKKMLVLAAIGLFALPAQSKTLIGIASTYGWHDGFHGRQTASGEIYNQWKMTAAHKTLPFGTIVRVTNMKNKKSVVVRINDRGPYVKGRIIDLSTAAAKKIGMFNTIAKVKIKILKIGRRK